jgi:glycosyltransferase involved in cell wall biosynthesis
VRSTILIVHEATPAAASSRALGFASALNQRGHRVFVLGPRRAALRSPAAQSCVITVSPSLAAHCVGYMLHLRGTPWIADLDLGWSENPNGAHDGAARLSPERRLLQDADCLTCSGEDGRRAIFERLQASASLVPNAGADALERQVQAVIARRASGDRLRVLMIGPVNSPHMEQLALSMNARGHLVQAGGSVWAGGLPPSALPDAGIPISVMTWPQPLWMRRLVRAFRPDVIHANWLPFAAVAAMAGARPLVAMAWGSDVYLAEGVQRLTNRLALRYADMALADSAALLERLVELGADDTHAAVLNWGVDLKTFVPAESPDERRALRASLGLGDGPVIISPRGFKDLYNPDVVLAAFARVSQAFPDAQLVLKHQGREEPDLGVLAECERVHVVGRVPYEQMADYFRAADVCLSIPSSDSSPRSVWEAMACGCACVLSDLPWAHELINPDTDALLVPSDAEAVARAIGRVLTQPELHRLLSERGPRLVRSHRNAAREMDRLEALYLELASRPGDNASAQAASRTSDSSPANFRRE